MANFSSSKVSAFLAAVAVVEHDHSLLVGALKVQPALNPSLLNVLASRSSRSTVKVNSATKPASNSEGIPVAALPEQRMFKLLELLTAWRAKNNAKGAVLEVHGNGLPTGHYTGAFKEGVFIGKMTHGKPHGKGEYHFQGSSPDYAKYQGSFRMGKRHGRGSLTLRNGGVFAGNMKLDEIEFGKLRCANGAAYDIRQMKDGKLADGLVYFDPADPVLRNYVAVVKDGVMKVYTKQDAEKGPDRRRSLTCWTGDKHDAFNVKQLPRQNPAWARLRTHVSGVPSSPRGRARARSRGPVAPAA